MKAADVRALIEQNKGSVFLYVDSAIPCQSRDTIMEEYRKAGKEFLVSNNGDGSCVFGVHAHWLIPAEPKMPVIDWVRKYLRPLTAESSIFAEIAAAERAKGRAKAELYPEIRRWYAKDKGETTIREVLAVMAGSHHVEGVPT